jgi:hypothetical protein
MLLAHTEVGLHQGESLETLATHRRIDAAERLCRVEWVNAREGSVVLPGSTWGRDVPMT